jgi:Na+-driven multidrug efflux pump
VSAIVSFLRVLFFEVVAVITLPLIFEVDGIWLSVVIAESVAMIMDILVVFAFRKKYNY